MAILKGFPPSHTISPTIHINAAKVKKLPLPKWTDVYPQGTKAGDEEQRFFIALARNTKYKWRSVAAIQKEANLSRERTEQIILKYFKRKMVYQNPQVEDQWGYWERVPECVPDVEDSIGRADQKSRIDKAKN
jgi:hypothetical protein